MTHTFKEISDAVETRYEDGLSLLQKLMRTPSHSGQEAEAATLVAEKMRSTGFDVVKVDRLNDVLATLKGGVGGRSLLLNSHLDHIPVGDMSDPYSGKLMDGRIFGVEGKVIYGRGASDMKGAVAAMVMAGAIIKELDIHLLGDFKVSAVAQEETGGHGTLATIQEGHFLGDVVFVGEATNMDIALGHRGGAGTSIVVQGRSCHASAPERGINALYKATDLINRIRSDLIPRLPDHTIFGKTTLSVTKIEAKPGVANVVPEECEFYIDCRNTPNFPAEALKREVEKIISEMRAEDPELKAHVITTNLVRGLKSFTGFYTDPASNPVVHEARRTLTEALGREPSLTIWRFATDGRFYSWMGIPVLGFGPGEERFAHTSQDHVRVDDYINAIKAYAWLACRICGVE